MADNPLVVKPIPVTASIAAATTTTSGAVRVDDAMGGAPVALVTVDKGAAGGVAPLQNDGLVPSLDLPPLGPALLSEQGRWVKSASNPIVSPVVTWEGTAVYEPSVLYENGTWKMWYSGGWSSAGVGYATCTSDPTVPGNWTKYAGNPVVGQGGSGIAGFAARNNVVKIDSTYYMYYADANPNANIRVATSTDGIAWTAVGIALASSAYPSAGILGWANSTVWREGTSGWKMLVDSWNGTLWRLCLATSTDGLTWTVDSHSPLTTLQVAAGGMYGSPCVPIPQKRLGLYELWYHATAVSGNLPTNMYRATSPDLLTWTIITPNPVLSLSGSGFEIDQIADPLVLEVDGASYLFYDGVHNSASAAKIGVASVAATLALLIDGSPVLGLATTTTPGLVQPDGTTIAVTAGVISAVGGGGTVTAVSGTAPIAVATGTTTPVVSITDFVASGGSHARGAVPDPGSSSGTTKFLREDASWQVPAGGGGSLTTANAQLSADVTMASGNTFYDGPSVSLAAGTWLITAVVTLACGASGGQMTAKLWDGTTVYSSAALQFNAATLCDSIALTAIVAPGTTTTYKISAAYNNTTGVMKAASPVNGAGNNATTIVALKVG